MFRKLMRFVLPVAIVRRVMTLVLAIVLAMTLAPTAHAAPVRSGTIIGGWFPFAVLLAPGGTPECSWNADCLAWLASDCNPALAGRDPALHASIVNVRKLAGSSKKRMFRILPKGPGIIWGGVGIEFWTGRCGEVYPYPSIPEQLFGSAYFKIPSGAVWMTVASVDDTTFDWQLH